MAHQGAGSVRAPGGSDGLTRDEVRRRIVALGCEWYGLPDVRDRGQRQDEIEAEVVCLLRDNQANLPAISSLKRDCANVSFFPSMIDTLFLRAFPPTADDRARLRGEWALLDRVAERIGTLSASGDATRAEALRKAAVTFFNAWLTDDEVDLRIQAKGRATLRKR